MDTLLPEPAALEYPLIPTSQVLFYGQPLFDLDDELNKPQLTDFQFDNRDEVRTLDLERSLKLLDHGSLEFYLVRLRPYLNSHFYPEQ